MKVTDGWGTVCCRHFLDVEGFGFLWPFPTIPKWRWQMRLLCGTWLCFVLKMIGGVRDLADLIFLSGHGSETCHGKDQSLARSSEVRVYLWSEWYGVVTDTLTLFRYWLQMVGSVENSLVSVCWFDSTSVRNSGPACFISFCRYRYDSSATSKL